MSQKTLWINPFNGVAGDMLLGALIDAGAELERIEVALGGLDLDGWHLRAEPVDRSGIRAVNVTVESDDDQPVRRASDIVELIGRAPLVTRAADRALSVFDALARAEAAIHGTDVSDVHFHEVGAVDAIIDIVGVSVALEVLEIDRVVVGPVALGSGRVSGAAHGDLPNPAPATVRLLEGWPVVGLETSLECTTPTGAALVAALGTPGPVPTMTVAASGFGSGDAEPEGFPNVLQVLVGEASQSAVEPLVVLETNVDDASGETLAHAVERLLSSGALDAWITPILMKKGRPAHVVSVLAPPARVESLGHVLLRETGSIGYRRSSVERIAQPRRLETVELDGHEIAIKVTPHTAKAEHADVTRVAAVLDRPAREVAARAEALWQAQSGQTVR